jgi:hydroxymethylbilane synthase
VQQSGASDEPGQSRQGGDAHDARQAAPAGAPLGVFGPRRPLRLGTRGSALALAQTNLVVQRLRAAYSDFPVEVRVVRTEGDIDQTSPLTEIGGRGVFTTAIEAAIITGDVDVAVHSAKDLPSVLDPRTPIVAIPVRDDPRDVLVSRHGTSLGLLPPGPVIGTSSRRREVQVRRLRPDAHAVSIRGNIDTRLRKAEDPALDGIIVAAAGLLRMGRASSITEIFAVEEFVPSPGQGAIAVQALAGSAAAALLAAIDDPVIAKSVSIERAFLEAIGAGCSYPVGAYAAGRDTYRLLAFLADPDGHRAAFVEEALTPGAEEDAAAEIARRLIMEIGLRSNAHAMGIGHRPADLEGARVVVTRPQQQATGLIAALQARGAAPLALPAIRIEPVADSSQLDSALTEARAGAFDWLVFSSANAVVAVADRLRALGHQPAELTALLVAAVGPATAAAAVAVGLPVRIVPGSHDAAALALELRQWVDGTTRVLYPRSAIGRDTLPDLLRRAGADVVDVAAYRTLPEHEVDAKVLANVRRGDVDAVTFFSPSSVRNFLDLVDLDLTRLGALAAVCAGPTTAHAAREAGLHVVAISETPSDEAVVDTLATWWRGRQRLSGHERAHRRELAGRSSE